MSVYEEIEFGNLQLFSTTTASRKLAVYRSDFFTLADGIKQR